MTLGLYKLLVNLLFLGDAMYLNVLGQGYGQFFLKKTARQLSSSNLGFSRLSSSPPTIIPPKSSLSDEDSRRSWTITINQFVARQLNKVLYPYGENILEAGDSIKVLIDEDYDHEDKEMFLIENEEKNIRFTLPYPNDVWFIEAESINDERLSYDLTEENLGDCYQEVISILNALVKRAKSSPLSSIKLHRLDHLADE